MNILEDLWFGNISPWERPFKKDSAYAELLALVVRHQEDLLSRLNDEEKEIFEKIRGLHNRDARSDRAGGVREGLHHWRKDHHRGDGSGR